MATTQVNVRVPARDRDVIHTIADRLRAFVKGEPTPGTQDADTAIAELRRRGGRARSCARRTAQGTGRGRAG